MHFERLRRQHNTIIFAPEQRVGGVQPGSFENERAVFTAILPRGLVPIEP